MKIRRSDLRAYLQKSGIIGPHCSILANLRKAFPDEEATESYCRLQAMRREQLPNSFYTNPAQAKTQYFPLTCQ